MLNAEIGVGCSGGHSNCQLNSLCPKTPDFCIKRNDTKPPFRISISDCDGVVDLTDENLVLEASMWLNSKLKNNISDTDANLYFADNLGFDQIAVGDVIVFDKPRNYEKLLIQSIDELNKSITVQRGHDGTAPKSWSKGTILKIFKFAGLSAQIESTYADVSKVDGTVTNELVDTSFVFNWTAEQTSLSGCYWFEFKLMNINPSSGDIDWVKSFPLSAEGFLISVLDSSVTI